VFFKETKQHLKLSTCHSRDFDAQIAHVTTCYILYIFLTYFRRMNAYESLGGLFEELLQTVINAIAESGVFDIKEFRNSVEYQYLKGLFEDSFLGNQLKQLDNAV